MTETRKFVYVLKENQNTIIVIIIIRAGMDLLKIIVHMKTRLNFASL